MPPTSSRTCALRHESLRHAREALRPVVVFLALAFVCFFWALQLAETETLASVFGAELGPGAADFGSLAGAHSVGLALLQFPMGPALYCHGPRRTVLVRLSLAVVGCTAFVPALNPQGLRAARLPSVQVWPSTAGFFRGDHQGADNHP